MLHKIKIEKMSLHYKLKEIWFSRRILIPLYTGLPSDHDGLIFERCLNDHDMIIVIDHDT